MTSRSARAFLLAMLPLTSAMAQEQDGDAARGRALFQQQCAACHQVAQPRNGVGPHLQGVMGRVAGTREGFAYSSAMRSSGVTWDPTTLEAYLANPTGAMRGTRMANRVPHEQQRRDIIAFLAGS